MSKPRGPELRRKCAPAITAIVQARELAAKCKTGTERDQELGRIDLAVENVNGAIAQSCGS
jgi:hypothetical protein